ncbi:PAS domain S-box protein [Phycicoccus sp. Root101]|uniref:PAS domain S-box protein n=1 Tax=Phycicoccus sp. Root101 TaxID=1736421 RepID=UPI000702A1FF|nr:PAS domain S-box protein [Phycicoccus sp. Root101]KQU67994.1 hypothetical protein ASC58_10350 [Phycicoccus sp. Root101]
MVVGEGPFTQWSERPVLQPEDRALAHRLGVAVYVAEPGAAGRWLHASPAVTAMIGLTPEALVADPDLWLRHLHPDDRERVLDRESRLQVDGRVRSEYRMIRPDGQIVWLVDDAAMARTAEGRIVQDGFLVDITDQKRSGFMLAAQAELVEALAGPTSLAEVLAGLARKVMGMASAHRCVITVKDLPQVVHPPVTATFVGATHSSPIKGQDGSEMGCVTLHYMPGTPPPEGDLDLPEWAAQLAALAVTRAGERERAATSRALLAATLESTVDGILVVDRDGHIVGHNERFASMWRIDREVMNSGDDGKVMGSVLEQLVDPDGFVAQVRDLYDHPEQTSFDELRFLDGRIYERYSQPQRVDGTTMGRVWSFRDVSDERRLQDDLRHSEANLDMLVTQVRDYAILNLDPHGHVITWTEGALRIHGFTEDQILGRSHAAFYPQEDLQAGRPWQLLEQARSEGRATDEGWRVRQDGSRFWASVVLTALRDESGELRGFGKVTQDITERRNAELALARQARTLELLGSVATASNTASGVEEALHATLEAFCDYGGWQLAHAYLADHDTGILQHSEWYSRDSGCCSEFRARTEMLPVSELGLPRTVFEQAKPQWIDRLDERAQRGRAVEGTAAGLVSGCAFPLMIREEPVGVLEFFSTEIRELDSATIQIMRHLGTQLGRVVERARAEHHLGRHALELRRLSKRLETVLNSAGEGIYGVDDTDHVTFINEAGAALVGRRREEIIGRPVQVVLRAEVDTTPRRLPAGSQPDAIPGSQGSATAGSATQRSATQGQDGTPVPLATRVLGRHTRADGSAFDSEWISAPIVAEGVESGAVVVFRDVSEQRAVERMKDQFLAVVSHELRTPLTSIRGALGLLGGGAAGELPAAAGRMVDLATVSTNRLIRLVTDILDIERLAAGQMALYPQACDTSALVAASLQDTAAFVAERRVRIDAEGPPARVMADPDRAIQVLTNLITNAVKFSDPGSVVQVTTREIGRQVCFEVRDHGPGLPPDQFEVIFEPFRQADASDTRRHGGTGLGLAICRGLVEQHGGRIWGTNHPQGGAQFSFTLPLAPTEEMISSV